METKADRTIKDLKKKGIKKGATIKGLNNGVITKIISKLVAEPNDGADNGIIIIADTEYCSKFIIYWDELQVELKK